MMWAWAVTRERFFLLWMLLPSGNYSTRTYASKFALFKEIFISLDLKLLSKYLGRWFIEDFSNIRLCTSLCRRDFRLWFAFDFFSWIMVDWLLLLPKKVHHFFENLGIVTRILCSNILIDLYTCRFLSTWWSIVNLTSYHLGCCNMLLCQLRKNLQKRREKASQIC